VRAAPRVSLVMCVFNGLEDTRACLESLRATTEPFRLVVMDNGSTDGTTEFFTRFPYPYALTFARSPANDGVIAALNRAWRLADTEVLCFLHNDTELSEPAWLARLLEALAEPRAGLAGVYGAKRLRADGRAVGRTIVSSLLPAPTVRAPREDVAFVDSVCMCLPRDLMETVGGFDEGYGFYHGHDRDLSLAVLERGRRCLVVLAPFRHHGGRTRTRDFARDPAQERADLAMRDAALARFARKWRHRLPCDVRSARQRMGRSEVASPPAVRCTLRAPADGRLAQDEERTPRRPVGSGLAASGGMRSDMTNVTGARLVSGRFTQARLARRTRCGFALPRSAPASRAPME